MSSDFLCIAFFVKYVASLSLIIFACIMSGVELFSGIVIGGYASLVILLSIEFLKERSRKGFQRSLPILLGYTLLVLAWWRLGFDLWLLAFILALVGIILAVIFLSPTGFPTVVMAAPDRNKDERTTMFSRMFELHKGSPRYDEFYRNHPTLQLLDDRLRDLPGLLSEQSTFYDARLFGQATTYSQQLTCLLPEIIGNPIVPPSVGNDTYKMEKDIRSKAKELGAVSVGFTTLNDYHFYTHKGRGEAYGSAIEKRHTSAIVITVEMDKKAIDQAPFAPVIAESSKQYLHAAKIAVAIAGYLRENGFEATAHVDANYEVICPLVAQDAGLGEIGRMGILMTPELGARVRIAVVTTNYTFQCTSSKQEDSLHYFCSICKLCVDNCPSGAIPEKISKTEGKINYQIYHEKCYGYWAKVGTDCARCISVCPFSHPNTWLHRAVRFGIGRNHRFARLALWSEKFFYDHRSKKRRTN